jgi:hypothetical protein
MTIAEIILEWLSVIAIVGWLAYWLPRAWRKEHAETAAEPKPAAAPHFRLAPSPTPSAPPPSDAIQPAPERC